MFSTFWRSDGIFKSFLDEIVTYTFKPEYQSDLNERDDSVTLNHLIFIANKGGKFLKKLWCCVGGRV